VIASLSDLTWCVCCKRQVMTAHVLLVAGGCSVLSLPEDDQPGVLFIANGVLSTVSDNVFVATVFIKGVAE